MAYATPIPARGLTPRPYIKGFGLMSIDLSDFTAIADILVIEKRNCSKCHFGSYQPTGIMRLWTSHTGPHRHALIARKREEIPLAIRGTRVVETLVESCLNCWKPDLEWDELTSIVPRPPDGSHLPLNGTFEATATRKLREAVARANAPGVSREARARVNELVAPKKPITLEDLLS